MKKKKKQQKKKTPGSPLLSLEEQTRLDALLKDLQAMDSSRLKEQILSPGLALALVDKLPLDDPGAVDLLLALRTAFDQKDIQKAVKKALFKLRQKGVSIPEDDSAKDTSILKVTHDPGLPEASLGAVDGAGSRPVFVTIPRIPTGFQVGMGIVNEETGIVDFLLGDYSKKRMKEVKDLFARNFSTLVETPFAHAATILERAYDINGPESDEALRHYRRLRPYIQDNVTLLDRSPVYDHIPLETLSEEALTDSQIDKLFEQELLASWFFDIEKMEPLVQDIKEAEESPIMVGDEQKAGRIEEIKAKFISEIYPESRRLLIKTRLEETAYFFFKLGEEAQARTCLLAAVSMNEQSSAVMGENPFLTAMLERTLRLYLTATGGSPVPGEEAEEKQDEGPSLIVS